MGSWRLYCGSSSSALVEELWRLSWSLPSFGGLGSGGRLPVSEASPVTFLAEGRPHGAMAPGVLRRQLLLFLPASMPKGRQCSFGFESTPPSGFSWNREWRGGGPATPSGFVPGGGQTVSKLKLRSGPDCFLRSQSRVLPAKNRDFGVIFFLFRSLWSFVPAPLCV